jgi:hypothetical protein
MTLLQFAGIVCLFWAYVTLSNVLYAYGMNVGIAHEASGPLFVGWEVRVVQHLLLLPVLLVSYWASLRIRWRPLWLAIPLQLTLGAVFASLARPVLILATTLLGVHDMVDKVSDHADKSWFDQSFMSLWMASFVNFLPAYGFGLALITGLALFTRFRDAELRVAALEREWGSARLAALRMQLSPHTLFNLLHTIRGQIEWDPKSAQAMVVQLADLLRRLLNAGERDFSRLADELQFVRLYLELQQKRFADRLTISLPGADELPAVWVPSLILQPLVENAVVHGLAMHQGPVSIHLGIESGGESLTLRVSNTVAPGKPAGDAGIGLNNVRERLSVQFGALASLSAGADGAEWTAQIVMPMIREPPPLRAAAAATGPQSAAVAQAAASVLSATKTLASRNAAPAPAAPAAPAATLPRR